MYKSSCGPEKNLDSAWATLVELPEIIKILFLLKQGMTSLCEEYPSITDMHWEVLLAEGPSENAETVFVALHRNRLP